MDKEINDNQIAFAEVEFALPAQGFRITCAISTEESLPVVTEFALRMIHISGAMRPDQIQRFFGFNEKEVAAVIRTLHEERLVRWEDESLELTHYALSRFLESSDSIPRFFKIRDWSNEVNFDLISFSPAGKRRRLGRDNPMIELSPRNPNKESNTLYWAERSFQENYRRILRQDRVEIYKISEVEPGEHFQIAVPCTFSLNLGTRLEIKRSIVEEALSDHLEISNAISDALSAPDVSGNSQLSKFAALFDDAVLNRFINNGTFNFSSYVESVHVARSVRYENGTEPLLGSLTLAHNRNILERWIESSVASPEGARQGESKSAFWLGPQSRFWSRSNRVRLLTDSINSLLRGEKLDREHEESEYEKQRKESGLRTVLQLAGIQDVAEWARVHRYNFVRLFGTGGEILGGKCELFLVPNKFVVVLFHYTHDYPIPIPLGFVSSDTGRVETARLIFEQLTTGKHKAYPLNRDSKEEIDLKKEFSALASG
ncbi:MAG: hypothetical protein ABSH01_00320 [Terriglobia bacterium]